MHSQAFLFIFCANDAKESHNGWKDRAEYNGVI